MAATLGCVLIALAAVSSYPTRAQEIVLAHPTNVRADSTIQGIVLTWDAPDVGAISGSQVQRRWLNMRARDELTSVVDTYSALTTYTDADVETGVLYANHIRALLADGRLSSWSSHSNAKALAVSTIESIGNAGVRVRTWRVMAGELPPGLYLDPYSGQLSGIPMEVGDFSITVERQWITPGAGR